MNTSDDDVKDEGPQDIDLEELGEEGQSRTRPCPACGAEIYEDADRCGACGQYVVARASSAPSGRWKWVAAALAALGLALWLASC